MHDCGEKELEEMSKILKSMPRIISETLYFWVIRSGCLYIKVATDLDDSVILEDHCDYLVRLEKSLLFFLGLCLVYCHFPAFLNQGWK